MSGSSFIVGVLGGSGSGKTFFIDQLSKKLPEHSICKVSQDNYYKNIKEVPVDARGVKNFDTLEAINFDAFFRDIQSLQKGERVELKEYTFNNSTKAPKTITLLPAPIIIVEGVFSFAHQPIRELFDLKLFVEAPNIVKIKRRIIRDAVERGYDMNDVLYRYEHHVDPAYHNHILPYRDSCDLIIPNTGDISLAIKLISSYLNHKLGKSAQLDS